MSSQTNPIHASGDTHSINGQPSDSEMGADHSKEALIERDSIFELQTPDRHQTFAFRGGSIVRNRKPKHESLNYDTIENGSFYSKTVHGQTDWINILHGREISEDVWKWILCFVIGAGTAVAAFFIDFNVDKISEFKFKTVRHYMTNQTMDASKRTSEDDARLVTAWALLSLFNVGFVFIASSVCAFFAQCASGSGIPEIKCFLNGMRNPDWLTFRTMLVKVFGVLFSVGASMPVGKEGPMIHSGAIVSALVPKVMRLKRDGKDDYIFRNDRQLRDFVSCGAASGVAAAFGAPIGGVLFSLEEGCSFWNQGLTWRVLFSSMSTLLVLNFFISGIIHNPAYASADKNVKCQHNETGGWGRLETGGLIDFGTFDFMKEASWEVSDLAMFILIGAGGGLMGAAWNATQTAITKYRMRRAAERTWGKWWMVTEACFFSLINTTIMFALSIVAGTCQDIPVESCDEQSISAVETDAMIQGYFCDQHQFNDMASLTFNPLEKSIKELFHYDGNFSWHTCTIFFMALAVTSCWTYGLMIPSGLFVPSLAAGAAYGRLVAELLWLAGWKVHRGAYALVGAAAFLGGVVRMTISLTVILMEATNQVALSFPIMVSLMVAKWVADCFNIGIYDIHIHLKKIPLLEADMEHVAKRYLCKDVMTRDIKCFEKLTRLSDIVDMLTGCYHNGFPVVDELLVPDQDSKDAEHQTHGFFLGTILRYQLMVILKQQGWGTRSGLDLATSQRTIDDTVFSVEHPHHINMDDLDLPTHEERQNLWIDLRPYMNMHPYTLTPHTTIQRAYTLFRGLGLRHVPILNTSHHIVGFVTRKELSSFRMEEIDHAFEHAHDQRH